MKKSITLAFLSVCLTASMALIPTSQAKHHEEGEEDLAFIAGKGMCARCELGKADSCQNTIQVEKQAEEGEKDSLQEVHYFLTHNQVSKDFHGEICQDTKLIAAKGKLEQEDEVTFRLTPQEIQEAEEFEGKAMCARCELGQAEDCQTVIQAEKEGKEKTYSLTANEQSEEFHSEVCQGVKPVHAIGVAEEVDNQLKLTVGQIRVAEKEE